MSVLDPASIESALGGTWLQRPQRGECNETLRGVAIDTREDVRGCAFFAIRGERFDGHDFLMDAAKAGARVLVVGRGEAGDAWPEGTGVIRVDDTRRALGRLARAHRRTLATTTVIAVTGSAGKTTTKRLIHGILSRAMPGVAAPKSFNNDIGVPLTLLAATPRDRYEVVEIGTNAPGEIAALAALAEPDVAVLTMIGHSHLERFNTVEAIGQEKASILQHLREGGTAIVNADFPRLREPARDAHHVVFFGEAADANLRLTGYGRADRRWWFEIGGRERFELGLPGRHNAINALAAVAVARQMGVSEDFIAAGLRDAKPESMRMVCERVGSIEIWNDAYNANPDSMIAALNTFAELAADAPRRVVILGDMLELGPAGPALHGEIGRHLAAIHQRCPIDEVVLIGALSAFIAEPLGEILPADRVVCALELSDAAMDAMMTRLQPGDRVLIKASRGMALERFVDRLRECSSMSPPIVSRG